MSQNTRDADNRTFSAATERSIDSDNTITKDHPRLNRTTNLNVAIVLLHSAIIITNSTEALKPN